jgi:hypothetical protein
MLKGLDVVVCLLKNSLSCRVRAGRVLLNVFVHRESIRCFLPVLRSTQYVVLSCLYLLARELRKQCLRLTPEGLVLLAQSGSSDNSQTRSAGNSCRGPAASPEAT